MNTKVILIGGFIEIIELCEDNNISIHGIVDNNIILHNNYRYLGTDNEAINFDDALKDYPLIISPDAPRDRKKLKKYYENSGFGFFSLISSASKISKSSVIGIGAIIQRGVNISSEVSIGDFVKLNIGANIMHNSNIGEYTTIAPNAVILGHVSIGEECYIGANATILPNIKIAKNVTIGAGAVVTKNIVEEGGKYIGIPAKKINI